MSDTSALDSLFDALASMPERLAPTDPAYLALRDLLRAHFRASGFARAGSGPQPFGPFGTLDLPYRSMGAIDSVDLFGIDELIIFSFYRANRARYRRTIDIGANLGLHSILMGRLGFAVTAFEPDPVHFELLQDNLARNGITTVSPQRAAVSEQDGEAEFVRVLGNTTGSHLAGAKANPYGALDRFTVPVRAIGPLATAADFAKIDAEGHEVVILKAIPDSVWRTMDAMVEVGTPENAAALFAHLQVRQVRMFAQKTGWRAVTRPEDMPTSHREGSLFLTTKDEMPWG